ncbi:F-box protein DOR [Raphanus sativus]|uniref:F-box protein At2g19630 n=1 Tax=Raphanus sativus TaxID=3726 RepID=A0A9W3BXQ0_RAPSA|nr:putative F-box protein At2g19630 [Raphanus sativus]KAJ4891429.1 F-box protein DOR [Raphanus sativus]
MKKQASLSAMKARRRNVSDSPQTNRRRSSRLSAIDELLLKIPIDLIIEIFSRLPLKSIARCRCVSKQWASVLRGSDFTQFFLTKALARQQLLFYCQKEKEVSFFSSVQPQNVVDEDSSPTAAVDHHMTFPFQRAETISSSVNGFLCINDDREVVWVICNPSTRQSFTLPKMKTRRRSRKIKFLGYDPIEKQHKVLAMIMLEKSVVDHQVLTLGNGNMTWRLIECGIPHYFPGLTSICINGVLYYTARGSSVDDMIVCFDVRSEKYSFVRAAERGMHFATLINFQGKLASTKAARHYFISGRSKSFEIWILDDPEKHEWSKCKFRLPLMWGSPAVKRFVSFVGVTATNEFVFSSFSSEPFYVYYYNFVKNSITRVQIEGMGGFKWDYRVGIFLNHVEDVKLMELF